VSLPGKRRAMNSRVEHFLLQLGLTDRIVDGTELASVRKLIETPIDWQPVNEKIRSMRLSAEAYLAAEISVAKAQ